MRAALYLRQSLDRTGAGAAVDRQRTATTALAESRGWSIVEEYVDNDVSASSGKVRPAYRRMLADAEAHRFDAVLAYHPDRIARRVVDLEDLIVRAQRDGFKIATVTGDLDLSNDMGRLVGRILASVASAEVERKGARQQLAAAQAATEGRPAGGGRSVGYEPDGLTVRPVEANLIRAGYRDLLSGVSLRGIARTWNDAGMTTTRSGPWRPDNVRGVLLRARYAGLRSYLGDVVGPGRWPGVVSEDTWRSAVAVLSDPSRRTTPDNRRRYVLSGLAMCGVCSALVDTGRTQHGRRTYKCSKTRHLSVAAEPIEELLDAVIVARLSRPDAVQLLEADRPDVEHLRDEAVSVRGRLDELVGLFAAGLVTASQLTAGSAALRDRLADLERRMADAVRVDVLGPFVTAEHVERAWSVADVDRRRAVVSTLADVTLLSPGRGSRVFRPDTVRIDWKVDR